MTIFCHKKFVRRGAGDRLTEANGCARAKTMAGGGLRRYQGDTLIEVALAIGVLSAVIMAVSTTMISSLIISQNNLEETMADSEINIQAEALRYIHNAYATERQFKTDNQEYAAVWQAITAMAITPDKVASLNSVDNCYAFYASETGAVGDGSIYTNDERSFIINTHRLDVASAQTPSKVVISTVTGNPETSPFQPATLYPRVLFGNAGNNDTILEESDNAEANLYRAEGVWVTAVCSDTIDGGTKCAPQPQYYDFYIRTCWDSATQHDTSTVGTIVRLHNPDLAVKDTNTTTPVIGSSTLNYYITYDPNGGPIAEDHASGSCRVSETSPNCIATIGTTSEKDFGAYIFEGWYDNPAGTGKNWDGQNYTFSASNYAVTLYAKWGFTPYIRYHDNNPDASGSVTNMPRDTITTRSGSTYRANVSTVQPRRGHYIFLGWATSPSASVPNTAYAPGNAVILTSRSDLNLYAVWEFVTYADWAIILTWSSGWRDLDSHTYICSGTSCGAHIYYSSKNGSYNGTKASLDHDDTSYGTKETTSVESLGNNGVYFCVHAYNSSVNFYSTNAKVTVYDVNNSQTWTFSPPYASAAYSYWSVLRLKNSRATAASSPYGSSCRTGW